MRPRQDRQADRVRILLDHRLHDLLRRLMQTGFGIGERLQAVAVDGAHAGVTLELGGKSAGIILDDIPLEDVLPTLVPASIGHSGQVCAALTRIRVPRERYDEVVDAIAAMLGREGGMEG